MSTDLNCTAHDCQCAYRADEMDAAKMPGHWVLARLGKRVLRPGGLELTRRMLSGLNIGPADHVVEFAPGLGMTARLTLARLPASYIAIERDETAAAKLRCWIGDPSDQRPRRVITGLAQQSGLPDQSATAVYGEAMLTMQTETRKRQIVREAFRVLRAGGRYGIHELCLVPDDLPQQEADDVRRSITDAIHHQAVPLTAPQWEALLCAEGFEIEHRYAAPMALLEPRRLLRDEGFRGTLRFLWRLCRDAEARRRVFAMRRAFRQHRQRIAAICLVARKRDERGAE